MINPDGQIPPVTPWAGSQRVTLTLCNLPLHFREFGFTTEYPVFIVMAHLEGAYVRIRFELWMIESSVQILHVHSCPGTWGWV